MTKFLGTTHINPLRKNQIDFRYENNTGTTTNVYVNRYNASLTSPTPTEALQRINGTTNICNDDSFEKLEKTLNELVVAFNLHKARKLDDQRLLQDPINEVPVNTNEVILPADLEQQLPQQNQSQQQYQHQQQQNPQDPINEVPVNTNEIILPADLEQQLPQQNQSQQQYQHQQQQNPQHPINEVPVNTNEIILPADLEQQLPQQNQPQQQYQHQQQQNPQQLGKRKLEQQSSEQQQREQQRRKQQDDSDTTTSFKDDIIIIQTAESETNSTVQTTENAAPENIERVQVNSQFELEPPPEEVVYLTRNNRRGVHLRANIVNRYKSSDFIGRFDEKLKNIVINDAIFFRKKNFKYFQDIAIEEFGDMYVKHDYFKHVEGINEILGEGGYGTVRKGRLIKDHSWVAVKTIRLDMRRRLNIEIKEVLQELRVMTYWHKNIVQMKNFYLNTFHETLDIAMEYMNCSLRHFLNKSRREGGLTEDIIIYIFDQILDGAIFLDKKLGLFHNDLKAENILLNEKGEVKICDFGMVKSTSILYPGSAGTSIFMAPEVANPDTLYDYRSDVWSLGIVLYEMIEGEPKFEDIPYGADSDQILKIVASRTVPPTCTKIQPSSYLAKFLGSILQINPDKRPALDTIKKELWMTINIGYLKRAKKESLACNVKCLAPS